MVKIYGPIEEFEKMYSVLNLNTAPVVQIDNMFLISGMTGVDPKTGNIEYEDDFRKHVMLTLSNVETMLLKSAGISLDHVVKVNAYLKNPEDFKVWNELFYEYFQEPYPARTTVVSALVVGSIEIEVVAASESRITT